MWWVVPVTCCIKTYMRFIVAIVAANSSASFSMSCIQVFSELRVLELAGILHAGTPQ